MLEWLHLASTINGVLGLLARVNRLRHVTIPLASVFRQLVFEVQELRVARFAPGTPHEYRMLQVWIRNALPVDARGVRFQTRWVLESSLLNVRTEHGLWLQVLNPDMANFSLGATTEIDLMSNGAPQHVGVAVKYDDDEEAYIVTPVGHHRLRFETRTWKHIPAALRPGVYNVDLLFLARGGKKTSIRLKVTNSGRGGGLGYELLSGHLAAA